MNIVIFSQIRLLPKDAGNIATIHQYIKRLKYLGHRVHYLLLNESHQTGADLFLSQQFVDTLDIIEDRSYPTRDEAGYYLFDTRYFEGLGEQVRDFCLRYKADVLICSYIFHSKILEFIPSNVLKIIDTNDRMTDRHKFLRSNSIKDEFFSCTKSDEAKYLSRADVIWARNERETNFFNAITNSNKSITVSHFDEPAFLPMKRLRNHTVGFLASDNEINHSMVKIVLSVFRKKYEGNPINIKLVIGGGVKKYFENQINFSIPSGIPIEFLGRISEPLEFYKSLDLVIVPILFGTGINVKMIEAMSFGLPIISTKYGIKDSKLNSFWHTAETIEQLIDRLWQLFEDDRELDNLSRISREYYQSFFTKNIEAFDNFFTTKSLLSKITFF